MGNKPTCQLFSNKFQIIVGESSSYKIGDQISLKSNVIKGSHCGSVLLNEFKLGEIIGPAKILPPSLELVLGK